MEARTASGSELFLDQLDRIDHWLCKNGVLNSAQWPDASRSKPVRLYAGRLWRRLPQYHTHFGLTPFMPSSKNIAHDVRRPMPLPDGSVDVYQSEDVFEHVHYEDLPAVFDEIYRVLAPNGLFRLSLPDYRCDILASRTLKSETGELLFDPGGGGRYVDGRVVDGGHVWFPVYESVRSLFEGSSFRSGARIEYLHYTTADGQHVVQDIDYAKGFVWRTPDHDVRVRSPRRPMSIVVDAIKN